jgi:hypothetical protein
VTTVETLLLLATATLAAATILAWAEAAAHPDTCAICGATHPRPRTPEAEAEAKKGSHPDAKTHANPQL